MKGRKPVIPPLGDVVAHPSSTVRVPACPDYLRGRARECWDMVVNEMLAKNIYDSDCRDMVAAYCVQLARFLTAEDDIDACGPTLLTKNKLVKFNPSLRLSNNAYDRMVRLASELGLTPVSRKRVVKIRGHGSQAAASKFLKSD